MAAISQDPDQDKSNRQILSERVNTVNEPGRLGEWSWDISFNPADRFWTILARHAGKPMHEHESSRHAPHP
ncbi:MAG: hypothetical protein AB7Q01_08170 [Gammaproteobacteria bacterium]